MIARLAAGTCTQLWDVRLMRPTPPCRVSDSSVRGGWLLRMGGEPEEIREVEAESNGGWEEDSHDPLHESDWPFRRPFLP